MNTKFNTINKGNIVSPNINMKTKQGNLLTLLHLQFNVEQAPIASEVTNETTFCTFHCPGGPGHVPVQCWD